jgi:DNA-binding NtrC family response regulator
MPRLVIVEGPWRGFELELVRGEQLLGRGEGCAIALPDKALSREHCRFRGDDRGHHLEDLGSTNGVLVNGARVEKHTLAPGDRITAGRSVIQFVEDEGELLADDGDATATIEVAAVFDRAIDLGWRADQYARLLDLGEALSASTGSAEVARRFAEWAKAELGARSVSIHHRRGDRFVESASIPASTDRTRRKIPRDVLHAASEGGRCVWVEAPVGTGRVLMPIGAPAKVLIVAEDLRAPNEELLRVLAHASRLAAGNLEIHAKTELLQARLEAPETRGAIIASSPVMRPVIEFVDRVAAVDATVLLLGESGTGKELVARAIHAASARSEGPFIAVNCGALPDSLVESELFGHEKGAFTGATSQRAGRFERANRGTLFLDELGDLPLPAQARLLRVLEDRAIERVGGTEPLPVDVRVIAATNKPLTEMVELGTFREDLYYRLSVLVLSIPSLRERKEDIALLAERFLEDLRPKIGRAIGKISAEALAALVDHPWPGNVRELRNAIERAAILGRGPNIALDDLPDQLRKKPARGDSDKRVSLPLPLGELERLDVIAALESAEGNKSKAARILGVDRATLYARLKAYELE